MANTWNPGEEGITPSYTNSLAEFDPATRAATSKAQDLLRQSENSALAENEPVFNASWQNNVSGKSNHPKTIKGKSKLSGNIKGIAASGLIIGIIAAIMAFLGGSHSLLAPAMAVLSDLNTNTQNTAIVKRLPKAINAALSKVNRKGWPSTVESALSNKLGSNAGVNVSEFDTNPTVRGIITDTVNGRAGGYYSNNADTSFNYHGNSRNVFNDFEQSSDNTTDMDNFRGTVNDQLAGRNSAQLTTTREEEIDEVVEDKDGNKTTEKTADEFTNEVKSDETKNTYATEAEAAEAARSQLSRLASKVSKIVTWGCTALQIGILAATTYQVYARTMQETGALNFLESPSKMMAGYGTQAGTNAFLNTITQAEPTSVTDLTTATISGDSSDIMNDNEDLMLQEAMSISTSGTEDHNVSAVESDGLRAILTQTAPNPAKSYNYAASSAPSIITRGLEASGVTMKACIALQASVAAFSLAVKVVPGIGQITAIGSTTWHKAKDIAINLIKKLVPGVLLNVAVYGIVQFLIPLFAKMYLSNAVTNFVGYAGGQNLAGGMSSVSATLARNASGQSLASKEVALAYNRATQDVIAKEAEVDRTRRSPFDITSSNTFLGSILYGLLPSTLSSSPSQSISSVSSLLATTSKSLANLTNQVSAAGEGTSFNTSFSEETCDALTKIGAACNAFGVEITVTDPEALDIDVNDPEYIALIDASLDCNGNECEVIEDSGLARYIRYGAMRTSPFGVYDINIANELQHTHTILSLIPYVGDALDLLNSGIQLANDDIITGAAYVASDDNPAWEENKYYSLYLVDNHILDQWGAYDEVENPVLAYMEKVHNEREAEDTTYVAKLSRLIGATQEDTEMMLDVIAYCQYLDNYDASTRLALDESTFTTPDSEQIIAANSQQLFVQTEESPITTVTASPLEYILYADIRNRSYAA